MAAPMVWLVSLLLSLLLAAPAWAAGPEPLQRDAYLCAGEPLLAEVFAGAVDAPGIPNTTAGTVPGAFVVLQWRGVRLQLPRSNNAGAPSYTDGRWWWSPADPDHPDFRQRRGGVESYRCEREQRAAGAHPGVSRLGRGQPLDASAEKPRMPARISSRAGIGPMAVTAASRSGRGRGGGLLDGHGRSQPR